MIERMAIGILWPVSEQITGQTITTEQLLRLRAGVVEELESMGKLTEERARREALLAHITTALGWRRPRHGGSREKSAEVAAAAWNARHD